MSTESVRLDNVTLLAPVSDASTSLSVRFESGGRVILEWPIGAMSYELEATPDLSAPQWIAVSPLSSELTDQRHRVTVSPCRPRPTPASSA